MQQPKKMDRINSRVNETQKEFIKNKAKKEKLTEGEVLRLIIDTYIANSK